MLPITKLKEDKPQGLFLTTDDNYVDLFKEYLPKLEKLEGTTKDEFMSKALNNETEFAYEAGDDDNKRNRKDT